MLGPGRSIRPSCLAPAHMHADGLSASSRLSQAQHDAVPSFFTTERIDPGAGSAPKRRLFVDSVNIA